MNVIASISLALFIFGLCGLLILHAKQLGITVRRNFEIQIFLKHHLTKNEFAKIRKTLSSSSFTRKRNHKAEITFVSKKKAKELFIKNTGEDFGQFLKDNPLRNSYVIKIKPEYYSQNELNRIQKEIQQIDGVFEVSYVKDLVNTINRNVTLISLILLIFGVFILITVIILIDNTIKIALFSQRFLIRSMQLVGATDTFIQKPFITQSLLQGIIGGLVSSLALFILLKYLHLQLPELVMLYNMADFLILIASLVLLGSLIGSLSAFRAVRKYLRLSLDELY